MQYKITEDPKYKKSADAAKQGLDSILSQLKSEVGLQKQTLSDFYSSTFQKQVQEQKIQETELRQNLKKEEDLLTAAKLRQPSTSFSLPTSTWVQMGILFAITIGLSML